MSMKMSTTSHYGTPVVVVLGSSGIETARRIIHALPGARLHGLKGRVQDSGFDDLFTETTEHLRRLFQEGHAIVGVCASGILVRTLGPVLAHKQDEPPLLAVAANGSAVVPLIGGHRGANGLARTLACLFHVTPAITTASDVRWGLALDEPPAGWRVANNSVATRAILATLVDGKPVTLQVEAGRADWITATGAPFVSTPSALTVRVTDRLVTMSHRTLVLHPPTLAIGVGCERGVLPEILMHHVFLTLAYYKLSPQSVAVVASLDLKADEPAVLALAQMLSVPARFLSVDELESMTPRLSQPSEVVFQAVGCHGVAEAAALAAAGRDSALVVNKHCGQQVTCAIARASYTINPMQVGRARGRLHVVGIGPGAPEWRTPAASAAIAESDHLVGYGLYLDLIGHAADGKERHDGPLGTERDRVCQALNLAATGETVSLICSGDAGIYALATLVFELMDIAVRADWNRIEVNVVPGVSAVQAAAARVGAPLGHDFCAISLSDLLTPWPIIARRLQAAATADFIIALYNPVSQRRQNQLRQARDILLVSRPAQTPVVLAHNLGRAGEHVTIIRLDELSPWQVNMLTLVIVGNNESRCVTIGRRRWVYTPRGYKKLQTDAQLTATSAEN
ncbi:Cobalamin biosynthesis protein CbiG / Cobalt-precorrin-3b C17-methyltransferase [invertebrate metagenome]|uniref:Cobalamin biosynthesis protein CbiG / Cobalt-precorrin-3b C17-methyltransferase n=1 Tax=invertebrate metagenome TaxID=1711999 RepID=A0A484H6R3_9ZZZZ